MRLSLQVVPGKETASKSLTLLANSVADDRHCSSGGTEKKKDLDSVSTYIGCAQSTAVSPSRNGSEIFEVFFVHFLVEKRS